MAQCIVKQPDGKYALFSTVSGTFFMVDVTAADVLEYFIEQAKEREEASVKAALQSIEDGDQRYMTWAKAVKKHDLHKTDIEDDEFLVAVEEVIKRFETKE